MKRKWQEWWQKQSATQQSVTTVYAAILSNASIAIIKLGAFITTGSAAMLSEFVHSFADLCNQTLLAVGIQASLKKPDVRHPYGYGKERFVWSLISAVGVFFLGCGITLYHGISTLLTGHIVDNIPLALGVLSVAMVLEGFTLIMAYQALCKGAQENMMTVTQFIKDGPDPLSVAVFAEDAAAVVGVCVAASALSLTYLTGNPVFDAIGSITIGLGLGGVATFLIQKNRALLLGTSLPPAPQQSIMRILNNDPAIKAVRNIKGEVIGPGNIRFKADIEFNGEALARQYLTTKHPDLHLIADRLKDPQELEAFLIQYGDGMVRSLAKEVDRIEARIKTTLPAATYIDLETD